MKMKNMLLMLAALVGMTGCVIYDDGMPPPPRYYPMFYESRIGFSYTHHAHHRAHFMPERGPMGAPAAKHPNNPKPAVPSRGPSRRNMPPTVR